MELVECDRVCWLARWLIALSFVPFCTAKRFLHILPGFVHSPERSLWSYFRGRFERPSGFFAMCSGGVLTPTQVEQKATLPPTEIASPLVKSTPELKGRTHHYPRWMASRASMSWADAWGSTLRVNHFPDSRMTGRSFSVSTSGWAPFPLQSM